VAGPHEHELRVILDAIPAPVFYKDAQGVYRGCNRAFEAYLGKARAEIVGLDVYGLSPKELADVYKAADDALLAAAHRRDAGVDLDDDARALRAGRPAAQLRRRVVRRHHRAPGVPAAARARRLPRRAHRPAEPQALHGTPRPHPRARAPPRRARRRRVPRPRSLQVRQRHLGHDAGDRLLAEIGRRLADSLRGSDVVARIGGDEFCAVLTGVADAPSARTIAERMLDAVTPIFEVDGHDFAITASIGISLYPDHATEPSMLLRQADDAMYRVKARGKNAVGLFG
jgi:PAS domain-containing protein